MTLGGKRMLNTKVLTTTNHGSCPATELTLERIDDMRYIYVPPRSKVEREQLSDQWEILINLDTKIAHVFFAEEDRTIENESGHMLALLAIHGNKNYTIDEFEVFFNHFGIKVVNEKFVISDSVISL